MKKILQAAIILLTCSFSTHAKENQNPTTKVFDDGLPVNNPYQGNQALPFGANLFKGNFQSQRNNGLDSDYIIASGDKIKMHLWGLLQVNEVITVDAAGKIYIPEIGTIKAEGTRAKDLQTKVNAKINTIYKDGVEAYVNVLTATPISVFVTGSVIKPGQYSGLSSDSILAYLSQAGGIDPKLGSFRKIRIMRDNQPISQADLYQFLRWGKLPRFRFNDGDTILVQPQGTTVTVQGDARNPLRFEFRTKTSNGQELMQYARPFESVTNVAVSGTRHNQPWTNYQTRHQFKATRLHDGDIIRFTSDAQAKNIDITIEGSHLGNSYYAVKKGARLQELLDYIAVDQQDADIHNIYIKRKKIAIQQRENLEKSLHRLERSVLTAPASSNGEAAIRAKEAELILKFIANAKNVKPEGRVIVSNHGKVSNIRLEDGDVVVIPQLSDVVTIDGEVQIPQAVAYARNASLLDYIGNTGGFTERADHKRIIIQRPNGQILMGDKLTVKPGDKVVVFPKIDSKNMQFTKDLTQIIYQIALGATIAL